LRAVRDDPNDDRILECALAAGADAVVSGDRHLLTLNRYEGIVIVSPREFLRLIV
jgi:predicted nucleic acid-binding protein